MFGFLKRKAYIHSLNEWMKTFSLDPDLLGKTAKKEIVASALQVEEDKKKYMPAQVLKAEKERNRALGRDIIETWLKQAVRVLSFCHYGPARFEEITSAEIRREAEKEVEGAFEDNTLDEDSHVGKTVGIALSSKVVDPDFVETIKSKYYSIG